MPIHFGETHLGSPGGLNCPDAFDTPPALHPGTEPHHACNVLFPWIGDHSLRMLSSAWPVRSSRVSILSCSSLSLSARSGGHPRAFCQCHHSPLCWNRPLCLNVALVTLPPTYYGFGPCAPGLGRVCMLISTARIVIGRLCLRRRPPAQGQDSAGV